MPAMFKGNQTSNFLGDLPHENALFGLVIMTFARDGEGVLWGLMKLISR